MWYSESFFFIVRNVKNKLQTKLSKNLKILLNFNHTTENKMDKLRTLLEHLIADYDMCKLYSSTATRETFIAHFERAIDKLYDIEELDDDLKDDVASKICEYIGRIYVFWDTETINDIDIKTDMRYIVGQHISKGGMLKRIRAFMRGS